ncbi:MAG: BCCT family transporter [Phycisphaeraceae bacterium]
MKVNPYVFWPASVLIALFLLAGALSGILGEEGGPMAVALNALQNVIVENFGWFYIVAVAGFLLFVVWLMFSRYGTVKLGKDHDEPEFSYFTWFAMLFSAGMGIGLVFWGVAEPLMHFADPPIGEARSNEAARGAINITFFHWGLHAWAIYIVVGLSLSYFAYRHDLPLTIRSTLYPLLGRHVHGAVGNVVDILAVFGTLFGLSTSLGLGVMQINAGLDHLGVLSVSALNQVSLIIVITAAATLSVVSGVGKGIRRLSELNMALATLLLLFIFLAGPTVFLLSTFVQSLGNYASSVVQMTFRTDAFIGMDWQKSWTMFYWGWWISWSPFVGMFIARVSRGRTIREFIGGVLLVPTLLTFFWMVVFGGTAIYLDRLGEGAMSAAVLAPGGVPTAVFEMLSRLPLAAVATVLVVLVVAIFFVTSSDSGSLVIDILTAGGNTESPRWQKVFWASMEGAVAAILLITGGLAALQTAAIATALPFCAIMVLICVALFKGLRAERTTHDPIAEIWGALRRLPAQTRQTVFGVPAAGATRAGMYTGTAAENPLAGLSAAAQDWKQRLRRVAHVHQPYYQRRVDDDTEAREQLTRFMNETVLPAFEQIKAELEQVERTVTIDQDSAQMVAQLTVSYAGEEEFSYAIRGHQRERMVFAYPEFDTHHASRLPRAETVLRSGRRAEHDVADFTRQRIIDDFIEAYAKWTGW